MVYVLWTKQLDRISFRRGGGAGGGPGGHERVRVMVYQGTPGVPQQQRVRVDDANVPTSFHSRRTRRIQVVGAARACFGLGPGARCEPWARRNSWSAGRPRRPAGTRPRDLGNQVSGPTDLAVKLGPETQCASAGRRAQLSDQARAASPDSEGPRKKSHNCYMQAK